jgi:hypothetical protein
MDKQRTARPHGWGQRGGPCRPADLRRDTWPAEPICMLGRRSYLGGRSPGDVSQSIKCSLTFTCRACLRSASRSGPGGICQACSSSSSAARDTLTWNVGLLSRSSWKIRLRGLIGLFGPCLISFKHNPISKIRGLYFSSRGFSRSAACIRSPLNS